MHKISNRIFEIFFKKTLDFLLAGFLFHLSPEMNYGTALSETYYQIYYLQNSNAT